MSKWQQSSGPQKLLLLDAMLEDLLKENNSWTTLFSWNGQRRGVWFQTCDVSHPKNPLFKGSDWRTHCVGGGFDVAALPSRERANVQWSSTLLSWGEGGIWSSLLLLYINIHLSPEKLTRGGVKYGRGLEGQVWGLDHNITHIGVVGPQNHSTWLCIQTVGVLVWPQYHAMLGHTLEHIVCHTDAIFIGLSVPCSSLQESHLWRLVSFVSHHNKWIVWGVGGWILTPRIRDSYCCYCCVTEKNGLTHYPTANTLSNG